MPQESYPVVRVIARTNVGGPSLQVTALMRGLDKGRFPQHLLRGSVDEGEADYLAMRATDVEHVDVPGLGRSVKPLDDLRALVFLTKYMRRERPAIVHTHTAKAGALGRVAAVLARVPIRVHTFHGHVLRGYFSPTVTRVVILVERVLAKMTTHTVVVGQQVLDDLVEAKIIRPERSSVIAPGVSKPPPRPRAEARSALGVPLDATVVTFVGRLTRIKRGERFIAVARKLEAAFPDAVFLVVGDGPEREMLEREAAACTNVVFAGWQSDMAQVYAASDLLVLTSDNEGMPVALIEGAMQGVPAVSTDVGAVRQVVADGESGFVVADVDGVTTCVGRLIADPVLRASMGAAAAHRAQLMFGEERLVSDYAKLYDQLILSSRKLQRRHHR
ncbi:MAG TPA: glycosyltransferase [Ilumatobacteraceae bacterium]|nr:glycosyltransferase [Ilumatobacteraceae bacterium]